MASFYGNDANNDLKGGGANDQLFGGNGNDVLTGSGDTFTNFTGTGTAADPIVFTSFPASGDDYLEGGPGTDGLWGADGNDVIYGGDGNDNGGLINTATLQGVPGITLVSNTNALVCRDGNRVV